MNDTTLNQYAAPTAEVADVAPPTAAAELRLFSAQGRIGRLRYLAYSTGASVLYNIALGLLVFSFGEGTTGAMIGVVLPILALICSVSSPASSAAMTSTSAAGGR